MKDAIGGTWLFQIVILFILLFTAYLCLSINKSKAYSIKDDIVNIIERHDGSLDLSHSATGETAETIKEITERLTEASYRTNGKCQEGWYGFTRDGESASGNGKNALYCIKKVVVRNGVQDELPEMYYFRIEVFYQLDLPVVNVVTSFKLHGDTRLFYRSVSNSNDTGKSNNGSGEKEVHKFIYWK